MALRLSEDLTLPLDAVTETFVILAKRGSGKSYLGMVFVEEFVEAGLPVCVIDPVGVFWGLRSSADGKGPGLPVVIFGGEHADLPLPAEAGVAVADLVMSERVPAVLDLSMLSKTAQRRFVADFMERLYHSNREPLHLVVDEADLFAPTRVTADGYRLLGAYEDVVRRGRARGLGCTSITQRPASLHTDIRSQSEVLIAMRLTGTHDVKAVDDWVKLHADDAAEVEKVRASLPSLPVGTAWFWSPGWLGVLQRVQVRRRRTFDSSATPKVGERRVQPRRFADVDLARLRERLDAVAEPEPADSRSTVKLRAEIADLRRQLAARPESVEKVVEVPVVTGEQEAALAAAVVAYETAARALAEAISVYGGAAATARPKSALVDALIPAPRQPVPAPTGREPRSVLAESNGTKFGRPERAVMVVLAQHPNGRTRTQLALLTGYSIKSSSLSNALGALRSAGLVTKGGEPIQATPEGIALASTLGDADPLPTGRDLYEWWASRLGRAERAVLDVLAAAWPQELSKDEIATRTGYSATSSSLSNALGKLRSLDLVTGWAASDEFMEATR